MVLGVEVRAETPATVTAPPALVAGGMGAGQ